jgi:hypothetical protein
MPKDIPLLGEDLIDDAKPQPGDQKFWSVTTIIGALDKPALVPWAAKETAKAAVNKSDTWMAIAESDGDDAAIKYLTNARYQRGRGQRSATDLGTAVHKALEFKAIEGRYRDQDKNDLELRPYLIQGNRFLKEFRPKYGAAELTVYSPTYGYAGTSDGIIELEGLKYLIDYKTSAEHLDAKGKPKAPYPEVALQLAAYRYADIAAVWRARATKEQYRRYYLLSETERALAVPMPEVDHGLAIFITPESYSVHPVRCDTEVFEAFLHVLEAARFSFETSGSVVGSPLIPPSAFAPQDAASQGSPT